MASPEELARLADFVAWNVPTGISSAPHTYGDRTIYHPDIQQLRTYIENELLNNLRTAVQAEGPESPRLEKARERLDFFEKNRQVILENLDRIVTTHLAIPYSTPTFTDPPSPPTRASFSMVEPWDLNLNTTNAERYRYVLGQRLNWLASVSMLQHYGAEVTIIPSSRISGIQDIWPRDPVLLISDGQGPPVAYISNPDFRRFSVPGSTFESFAEYLRSRGIEVREVNAEIEGGNVLFDPLNNVILYARNNYIGDIQQKCDDILRGLGNVRSAIEAQAPDRLESFDEWLTRLRHTIEKGNLDTLDISDVERLMSELPGIIPDGITLMYDGRVRPAIGLIKEHAINYYSQHSSLRKSISELNAQADTLQRATGIPVIPIASSDIRTYHLDTFASVATHTNSDTGETRSFLLISAQGTNEETLARLRQVYGDNIIMLNEEDTRRLGANLVQSGNTLITNGLSDATRHALETRGFTIRTPQDVGFSGNLTIGDSSIHCLTLETNGIAIHPPPLTPADGPGTVFHATVPSFHP